MKHFGLFLLLFLSISSYAQELDIICDLSTGSGLQLGLGEQRTQYNHTPVFTDLEVMFNFDDDPFFEYGIAFNMPLERRMGLALVPKVKLKKHVTEVNLFYMSGGIVYFAAGVDLIGGVIEVGFRTKVSDFVYIFIEPNITAYFLGDDLVEVDGKNGMVTQFNIAAGVSFKM